MKKKSFALAQTLPGFIILFITLFFLTEFSNGQSGLKSTKAPGIPDSILKIFEKSCMTCHAEGGKMLAMNHVNFSNWGKYTSEKQASKSADICKMVSKGKMPPKSFRESKPDLIPTSDQIKEICQWSETFAKASKK